MEFFRQTSPIGFMTYRRIAFIFSTLFLTASLVLIFTKGFNFGIDFSGGTLVQIQYKKPQDLSLIRTTLKQSNIFSGVNVNEFGSPCEFVVKIATFEKDINKDLGAQIKEILKEDVEIRRVDSVGAKVGSELRKKGIMSAILAIIGILLYVSFRFEWRFALASVAALVHDVIIALGTIVLFDIEVNLEILAAILTILGYSLNDTIIVFDRIREEALKIKQMHLNSLINESVTRTLSRTVLTSMTTLLVVVALFLFGGEIIHGLAFTLLVGILVGTYSSIFVASPILSGLNFNLMQYKNRQLARKKAAKEKEKQRQIFESRQI